MVGQDPPVSQCPEPIAIVGMGCRFPGGASSPSKLWELLLNKRSGYGEFPPSRLNIDGFYHPNRDRAGSIYTRGGYFIDEDPKAFDNGFFGITPLETMNLDPTQRQLLEVTFEAFDDAGQTLDSLSGSKTGVFVGNIQFDHSMMQMRDADFTLPYLTTGGSQTILSNRVNYIFNLKGPSLSLDTACSSSMYALHLAVNAIRNGDCDAAVVAGTQLILGPETQISCARLGAISPTSTCHTFDASADGYARAEGFGVLYIKRLSDALEHGDYIRAVIRGTAANTNGRTAGIAHPSPEGQEAVIRSAYKNAGGLDPSLTGFFECHGTGTPVGDPLEVSAIGRVFASSRTHDNPLLIGSIKTNLGHAEAAAGVAGIMKAVLAIEHGVIPPSIGLKNPNPNIDFEGARVQVVTEPTDWPSDQPIRRASVNCFGFGGANAHCILEHVSSVVPGYRDIIGHNGVVNGDKSKVSGIRRKAVLPFSARDGDSLRENIMALGSVIHRYDPVDIAYTLTSRKTKFPRRAFVVVEANDMKLDVEEATSGIADSQQQEVGFLFTGQGAQWPRMGLPLLKEFEAFRRSIEYQDLVLARLRDGPSWTIESALREPAEVSKIHEPLFSQTLCTAVQIALVDLLSSWSVNPSVSIGHSSGEIAAAYASGRLTAAEAIVVAYYRGKTIETSQIDGRMAAVGLGLEKTAPYLKGLETRVRIACYNSPQSVTISGDTDAVAQVKEKLDADKVFNRILKTGNNAYHSHHMEALGAAYENSLVSRVADVSAEIETERKRPMTRWVSSVTGEEILGSGPAYWRRNLESPVRFWDAAQKVLDNVLLVELGPHPTLAKLIKGKVCLSSLERGSDSFEDLLKLAGNLFVHGATIDIARVNVVNGKSCGKFVSNLPRYCFKHGEPIYHENRLNREWRTRKHLRHDVLGARIPGCSKLRPSWRNVLRAKDVAWLGEHCVEGVPTLTPAAYIAMATEAVSQFYESQTGFVGVTLEDVEFLEALAIPDDDFGVELVFDLQKRRDYCFEFNISAVSGKDEWTELCAGKVRLSLEKAESPPITMPKSARSIEASRWYERFDEVGVSLGPAYQNLSNLRARDGHRKAAADLNLSPAAEKSNESHYLLHPASLDAAMQLATIASHAGQTERMRMPLVLKGIRECHLFLQKKAKTGHAVAEVEAVGTKLMARVQVSEILEVKGLEFNKAVEVKPIEYDPCLRIVWKPDITCMSNSQARARFPPTSSAEMRKKFEGLERLAAYTIVDIYETHSAAFAQVRDPDLLEFVAWIQRAVGYAREQIDEMDREAIKQLLEYLGDVHEAKLIGLIHSNLRGILSRELTGLQVALQGDVLTEFYVSGLSIAWSYPQLQRVIDLLAHQNPRMHIIEVGGGTGGATHHVLEALSGDTTFPRYRSYTFTDVSSGFLSNVENKFAAHKNIKYKALNLEAEPTDQGFEQTYDLCVASQVVHTIGKILDGLCNIRKLLKPGGRLVMLEMTRVYLGAGIVLGTFPGYWNGVKDNRHDSPFVGLERWQELLTMSGFSGVDICLDDHEQPYTLTSVIVSTAVERTPPPVQLQPAPTIFLVYRHYIHPLGRELQKAYGDSANVVYVCLDEVARKVPACSRVIALVDISHNTLSSCNLSELEDMRIVISQAHSVVWVYAGDAIQGFNPQSGVTIGLLRTIVNELPSVKVASVGLQQEFCAGLWSVAQALVLRERMLQDAPAENLHDHEYILHDGSIHVSRLEPDEKLNERYAAGRDETKTAFKDVTTQSNRLPPTPGSVMLNPHAAYLLVGCLGGLGRSISSWMVQHGARHLVFLSRSGIAGNNASDHVDELNAAGAATEVIKCNVVDKTGLAAAIKRIKTPIKGVVHAAMVEGDAAFENATYDQLQKVLAPKVQGTINLHEVTLGCPLDFFVMTSSIVAVVGTQTQGFYSAANAFQDSFARHRRSLGLVAQSVAFGPILEVGFLSELPAVRAALARQGLYSTTEYEFLRLFESAVASQASHKDDKNDPLSGAHLITGLEPRQLHKLESKGLGSDAAWRDDARFSRLANAVENLEKVQVSEVTKTDVLHELQQATSAEEKFQVASRAICERLTDLCYLPQGSINPKEAVNAYGVDSLIAAELRNWLFKTFHVDVGFLELLSPNTKILDLVESVVGS